MNPATYEFRLITEVQRRPILYNPGHRIYDRQKHKNSAWQEIETVLNMPAPLVRKRWTTLRHGFVNNLHKQVNDETITWPYWKSMQFLRPFCKNPIRRRAEAGASLEETSDDDDYSEAGSVVAEVVGKVEDEGGIEVVSNLPNLTKPTSSGVVRRQLQPAANAYKRQKSSMAQTDPVELDEVGRYGESVAKRLRGFAPKDLAKAKVRIEQVLFEIEFGETC